MLLGLDWFQQTKVKIDPAARQLVIPKKVVSLDEEFTAFMANYQPEHKYSATSSSSESKLYDDNDSHFDSEIFFIGSVADDDYFDDEIFEKLDTASIATKSTELKQLLSSRCLLNRSLT